jgi:hypothetical protein
MGDGEKQDLLVKRTFDWGGELYAEFLLDFNMTT